MEHQYYICLSQDEKSGLAEHCVTLELYSKEVINIDPHTVNRDTGLKSECSWKLILQLIKK